MEISARLWYITEKQGHTPYKAPHDEAQALHHAKLIGAAEEKLEVARNLLKINLPLEQISKATGLTVAEIERLRIET